MTSPRTPTVGGNRLFTRHPNQHNVTHHHRQPPLHAPPIPPASAPTPINPSTGSPSDSEGVVFRGDAGWTGCCARVGDVATLCCHPRYRRGPTAPAGPAQTPSSLGLPVDLDYLGVGKKRRAWVVCWEGEGQHPVPPHRHPHQHNVTHHQRQPPLHAPPTPPASAPTPINPSTGSPSDSEGVVVVGPGRKPG